MSATSSAQKSVTTRNSKLEQMLDAVGWGLFFIWIGIALHAHVGWGVGLLGVGVLVLGGQGTRIYAGLKLDGLGIGVGLLFLAGGISNLLGVQLDLTPIICVAAGAALLVSAVRRHATDRNGASSSVAQNNAA